MDKLLRRTPWSGGTQKQPQQQHQSSVQQHSIEDKSVKPNNVDEQPREVDKPAAAIEPKTTNVTNSSIAASKDTNNNLSTSISFSASVKMADDEKKTAPDSTEAARTKSGSDAPRQGCFMALLGGIRTRWAYLVQIGEDWLYLALLGTIMAVLSFSMDTVITLFLNTRLWLYNDFNGDNLFVQYLGWCVTPIVLVTFSSGFVHLCSPTAIGSGIPEMKTILRGVVLNEYLTFRTLVAKIVGLTFTLGSSLPLGKEGPFVHVSSIVATLLSKLVASFQGIYENESRTSEMLSAACAVGVAATFYAPIGGVLFSIEITTVYLAVRNYWRGFFAACCSATIWRLLGYWVKSDESISALFKTNFRTDYPFDPLELLMFSFIGATCGLGGAAYIKFHREIVQFFRRHKHISGFLQKNRFVYPILVTLIITTVTFPPFIGKYTASTLSTHTTIEHLFSNRTWGLGSQDLESKRILDNWTTPHTNFYVHLILYIVMLFWTSALASTIPIPSGLFIPVLKMGAAYGRLLGELMHLAFPNGIYYGEYGHPASIVPGSYAVVGAAAFSGAVTHTISTSVILFEMTGQIVHIIPVILGVLIANAVCQSLQPSIYDSIIEIKKLPYLPPIASSNSVSHKILVKDFMNTNLAYVWKERCTYGDVKSLLIKHKKIISFPLVESPETMKLLGSVARPDLLKLLYLHLGRERRLQEVCRRNSETLTPAIQLISNLQHALRPPIAPVDEDLTTAKNVSITTDDSDQAKTAVPLGDEPNKSECVDAGATPHEDYRRSSSERTGSLSSSSDSSDPTSSSSTIAASTESSSLPSPSVQPSIDAGALTSVIATGATAAAAAAISASATTLRPLQLKPQEYQFVHATEDKLRRNSARLVLKASLPPIHYGATEATSAAGGAASNMPLYSIENNHLAPPKQRLSTVITGDSVSDFEDDESHLRHGVAKMVNLYDRGSTMDSEKLDKTRQEVRSRLAAVNEAPEVVVTVPLRTSTTTDEDEEEVLKTTPKHPVSKLARLTLPQPDLVLNEPRPASAEPPAIAQDELKRPSVITSPQSKPTSPSAVSTGPFLPTSGMKPKSILKTSSTGTGLSNMYSHREMSAPNFTQSMAGDQGDSGPIQMRTPIHAVENCTICVAEPKKYHSSHHQRAKHHQIHQHHLHNHDTRPPGAPILNGGDKGGKFTLGDSPSPISLTPTRQRRKVRLPRLRVVDMTPEEQEVWEREQLNAYIDIYKCQVDEAPFQLVERTSLYRVHTLFSMLGLNHAYVTSFGRLVGIVALKDIRHAIEKMMQEM